MNTQTVYRNSRSDPQTSPPENPSTVFMAAESLEAIASSMQAMIEQLETKLAPIVRKEEKPDSVLSHPAYGAACSLADRLTQIANSFAEHHKRIAVLVSNIDL